MLHIYNELEITVWSIGELFRMSELNRLLTLTFTVLPPLVDRARPSMPLSKRCESERGTTSWRSVASMELERICVCVDRGDHSVEAADWRDAVR